LIRRSLNYPIVKISAPAAGRIGKLSLEVGQYVQPGQTLFTIVNDEKYWVVANFKETQIEKNERRTGGEDHPGRIFAIRQSRVKFLHSAWRPAQDFHYCHPITQQETLSKVSNAFGEDRN